MPKIIALIEAGMVALDLAPAQKAAEVE